MDVLKKSITNSAEIWKINDCFGQKMDVLKDLQRIRQKTDFLKNRDWKNIRICIFYLHKHICFHSISASMFASFLKNKNSLPS